MSNASSASIQLRGPYSLFQTRREWPHFGGAARGTARHQFSKRSSYCDVFLRAIVDACASNVAVLDESGTILYASNGWRYFEGSTSLTSRRLGPAECFFEECRRVDPSFDQAAGATLHDDIQQILTGSMNRFQREYCRHGLESTQHLAVHGERIDLPGSTLRVLITLFNISDQKRAEEASRDLAGRLLAAQEDERRRVGRELHDDLNQRMALLSFELEQLVQEIEKPLKLRRRCQKLQAQAQEISADIHRLSYKLHPSKLDHLGLETAINSLCSEISESRKLNVKVSQKGFPTALPKDVALCVFRVAQEALRNCVKHSHAQTARVILEKTKDAVRLSVSDDGCGFDTDSDVVKNGLGLISMKERLNLVGGDIYIHSKRLHGTRIEVSVPLPRDVQPIDTLSMN